MLALSRILILLWTAVAAATFVVTVHRIATDPRLTPWREATLSEIAATTDAILQRQATPERLSALIATRLAEEPRNWLALDALRRLAADRGISLPPALAAEFDRLKAEDSGLLAQTGACLTCAWDATTCSLTEALMCNATINISPVGDALGLARGLKDYALDNPVDRLDLTLSVVGLGATLAALPSAGSSEVVKAGAGLLKTAAKMGRISRPLREMFEAALKQGIRWEMVLDKAWLSDPALLVRAEAFLPATRTVAALDDIRLATDMPTVLHILPMVDTAEEATGLARVAKAGGTGFVAKAEVLGKSRLLRATIRAARVTEMLVGSFVALAAALSSLLASAMERSLRRALKSSSRRGRSRTG